MQTAEKSDASSQESMELVLSNLFDIDDSQMDNLGETNDSTAEFAIQEEMDKSRPTTKREIPNYEQASNAALVQPETPLRNPAPKDPQSQNEVLEHETDEEEDEDLSPMEESQLENANEVQPQIDIAKYLKELHIDYPSPEATLAIDRVRGLAKANLKHNRSKHWRETVRVLHSPKHFEALRQSFGHAQP